MEHDGSAASDFTSSRSRSRAKKSLSKNLGDYFNKLQFPAKTLSALGGK